MDDAGSGNEPAGGAEIFGNSADDVARAEGAAIPGQPGRPEGRGLGDTVDSGLASGELELGAVDVPEHQPAVGSGHSVVVSAIYLVGVYDAQARLAPNVALDPEQVVHRMILAGQRAGRVVYGGEDGEVGPERLSGHLGCGHRLDDAPGVDQIVGGGELLD